MREVWPFRRAGENALQVVRREGAGSRRGLPAKEQGCWPVREVRQPGHAGEDPVRPMCRAPAGQGQGAQPSRVSLTPSDAVTW
jgi:hypothetical protein